MGWTFSLLPQSYCAIIAARTARSGLKATCGAERADWFIANFPGRVLYAAKANDAPKIIEALVKAGSAVRRRLSRRDRAPRSRCPEAELFFMNPVKSRGAIVRAYREYGVRSFAFDSDEELDKIVEETGRAEDLELFLRVACPNTHSLIPLEGKFGASASEAPALLLRARQIARTARHHLPCRLAGRRAAAFGEALRQIGQLIITSGVLVDAMDIGGGFPEPLSAFRPAGACRLHGGDRPGRRRACGQAFLRADCEPGRALVAEAESVIVRVDARRDNRSMSMTAPSARCSMPPIAVSGSRHGWSRPPDGRPSRSPSFALRADLRQRRFHAGAFLLPNCVREGDYIEIGQIGAYGRVLASPFNGFGEYDEVILTDEPMLSMYLA